VTGPGHHFIETGHWSRKTGHEKLVTGHEEKLNFLKTGHQIDWSGWLENGYDQTGHKSLKTLIFLNFSTFSILRHKAI
jgi:hypothetical protein